MDHSLQIEKSPSKGNTSPQFITPAPKRGRSDLQKSLFENVCKTPRMPNVDSLSLIANFRFSF